MSPTIWTPRTDPSLHWFEIPASETWADWGLLFLTWILLKTQWTKRA